MHDIPKRIVMDEAMQPVAVQIDIADWERIERLLNLGGNGKRETDLAQHMSKIDWPVDALAYQQQVRSEWE